VHGRHLLARRLPAGRDRVPEQRRVLLAELSERRMRAVLPAERELLPDQRRLLLAELRELRLLALI